MTITLYKQPPAWGLPSISPACIQAEAYLRLVKADYYVEECNNVSKSPSGQLPALEKDAEVSDHEISEYDAVKAIYSFAKKNGMDLDKNLDFTQRTDLVAFTSLVESKLNLATSVCLFYESTGFAEYQKVAFGDMPFPLNYVVPWKRRRDILRRLGLPGFSSSMSSSSTGLDTGRIFEEACTVLSVLADKIRSSSSSSSSSASPASSAAAAPTFRYIFGKEPSSLDAVVAGHLLFYTLSPAAAPCLKAKVAALPYLSRYVKDVITPLFGTPASSVSAAPANDSWSAEAKAGRGSKSGSKRGGGGEPTAAEKEFKRNSRYWMAGALGGVLSYLLFSGHYIRVSDVADSLAQSLADRDHDGDGDDGDEGDDDDDEAYD